MNTHDKIELPPLPSPFGIIEAESTDSCFYTEKDLADYAKHYARAAIEADRKRRGEPVAWQNRHKPLEIMRDDDLDPAWRDMYRPLYAFGPLCDSCNDAGVFTTDNEGPYDCYDCGRKAPQPAEPVKVPSGKPVAWLVEHMADEPYVTLTLPEPVTCPLAAAEVSVTPLYTRP